MVINERMKDILKDVVHRYITTAEPISSEMIAKNYKMKVSSATIRHDMYALEKLGFLKKPHTSAGRVPTDKGYRFYVDILLSKRIINLSQEERQEIIEQYNIRRDYNEMMRITSKLISRLTSNLGVVLAPNLISDTLKDIRFITLDNHRILVTLITNSGLFFQKVMKMNCEISGENLDAIANIIKREFYGKSLEFVNEKLLEQIYQNYFKYQTLGSIWKIIEKCFNFEKDGAKVFLGNRGYILRQPEFNKEIEKLNYIFDFIEEEKNLIKIIRRSLMNKQLDVVIGSELGQEVMQDCSVITRQYFIKGRPMGAISVLGPTRMNYPRALSILDFIADRLSEILSD